jgi:pentalenene oxygenase
MREQAVRLTGDWHDGEVIDVVDALNALAGQVVLSTMFGSVPQPRAMKGMLEDLKAVFRGFRWRVQLGPLRWLAVTANVRYARALARLRQAGIALIRARQAGGAGHGDLLSIMLARHAGSGLSEDEVSDQFVMFFSAGIETTAASVAWALFLLAQHPDVEGQLHAEVDRVLGGGPAGLDDIPRLEVTRRVMAETLRIRPPAWISSRTAEADIDVGRHRVPAGTTIFYSPCTIHHRADLYPDPRRFDPDRWIDRDPTRPDPGYIPFGVGARKCIGDRFALTEAVLVLATIAGRFRLRPVADGPVVPMLSAVLVPRQRLMRIEARCPAVRA